MKPFDGKAARRMGHLPNQFLNRNYFKGGSPRLQPVTTQHFAVEYFQSTKEYLGTEGDKLL